MSLTMGNNIISDKVAYLRMRIDKEACNRLKQWTTAVRIFEPSRRCIKTQFPSECSRIYKLISKYITTYTEKNGLYRAVNTESSELPNTLKKMYLYLMLLLENKALSHLDWNAKGFGRFAIQSFYWNIAFLSRILIMPPWFIFSSDGAASRDEQTFVYVKDCFSKPLGMLMSSLH